MARWCRTSWGLVFTSCKDLMLRPLPFSPFPLLLSLPCLSLAHRARSGKIRWDFPIMALCDHYLFQFCQIGTPIIDILWRLFAVHVIVWPIGFRVSLAQILVKIFLKRKEYIMKMPSIKLMIVHQWDMFYYLNHLSNFYRWLIDKKKCWLSFFGSVVMHSKLLWSNLNLKVCSIEILNMVW